MLRSISYCDLSRVPNTLGPLLASPHASDRGTKINYATSARMVQRQSTTTAVVDFCRLKNFYTQIIWSLTSG